MARLVDRSWTGLRATTIGLIGNVAIVAVQSDLVDILDRLRSEPLRTPHLYEQIAERLARDIAGGRLAPGDRLPAQRELARVLEVSRPSVREALASLENEGLIETRRGAGSFVATGASAEARRLLESDALPHDSSPLALLEAREMIEPMIAELAARRSGPDAQAEVLLELMDGVSDLHHADERRRWSDADRFFHRQLAVMSANPVLVQIAELIASVMDQPLWQSLRDQALRDDPGRVRLYAAEHRLIYDAVRAGNPAAAAFQAREHIKRVREDLIEEAT